VKIFSNKYFLLLARFLIALIFIFSGIEKIATPDKFAEAITNYKIFPLFTVNIIAIVIPWLELTAGILLLFGIWIKENAAILEVLLFLFTLLVAVALLRGLNINCGCFGTRFAQKIGFIKIGENILLLFINYILFKFANYEEASAD